MKRAVGRRDRSAGSGVAFVLGHASGQGREIETMAVFDDDNDRYRGRVFR